jgi:hypothetical protein
MTAGNHRTLLLISVLGFVYSLPGRIAPEAAATVIVPPGAYRQANSPADRTASAGAEGAEGRAVFPRRAAAGPVDSTSMPESLPACPFLPSAPSPQPRDARGG